MFNLESIKFKVEITTLIQIVQNYVIFAHFKLCVVVANPYNIKWVKI